MLVKVAIDLALDRLFTYEVPVELSGEIKVGQLLRVPFGHREARGFALELDDGGRAGRATLPMDDCSVGSHVPRDRGAYKIKPILGIADPAPFFSPEMLKLVRWISDYTCSPIELCLKAAVPAAVLKPNAKPKQLLFVEPVSPDKVKDSVFTAYQRELLENIRRVGGGWVQQLCREFTTTPNTLRAIEEKGGVVIEQRNQRRDPLAGRNVIPSKPLNLNSMQRMALDVIIGRATSPVLLHGVTGSGKTEVYLQAIAHELSYGRGAIVLVPEISLTPQTVRRFAGRFGDKVAVLHSALSDGERYDEWHRIRTGEARVVVGPRSAVFAPVRELGLIVVDEEHDTSYKQDETPRYNARDVAVMRGFFEKCKVVLGSATPSLESWHNVRQRKYAIASMAERVAGHPMPDVHVVNMEEECGERESAPIFSKFLLDAIAERNRRGEQTILFLNRRGYSRVLECKACGHVMSCPQCSVAYTYHSADSCLRCHICGGWTTPPPSCPECGAREFSYTGVGTQRAEQALQKCFPHARILRMDADSTSRKHSHDDILSRFRAREADILIGTQMIAKGLDFPNVTLVGVLNADASRNMPDFRAAERTFQLIAQVSGRAGRAEKPGEVFIQTFHPEDPVIQMAAEARFDGFADAELKDRKDAGLPPYMKFATALFRAKDELLVQRWADLYAKSLAKYPGLTVSEAMPPALERAEGWYRYQVQIRAVSSKQIAAAWRWIAQARPAPKDVRIALDIDAVNVM
ncbi:MAG: primosomal protein N' [Kiritimatiellae bacterium]|nr:primosomal protein N' [Kiritimatiellia bacterium]